MTEQAMSPHRKSWYLLVALGLFQANCIAAELIPGTDVPVDAIISGLPWEFFVSGMRKEQEARTSVLEAPRPVGEFVHNIESSKPCARSGSQGDRTCLRANLTSRSFSDPARARQRYLEMLDSADPDTGLTYAWDLVILNGRHLYRLHAGCLFSEDSFESMSSRLATAVIGQDGSAARRFVCRCGGGCAEP